MSGLLGSHGVRVETLGTLRAEPLWLLLAALCSLGVFIAVAGPALGRRRLNLGQRLDRLDPATWDLAPDASPGIAEQLLPLVADLRQMGRRVLRVLGFSAPGDLGQEVAQLGETPASFWREKAKLVLFLELLALVANVLADQVLDVYHGSWPPLVWLVAGGVGFFLPDLALQERIRRRRAVIQAELPVLVDLLSIGVGAPGGIQQAVFEVTPYLSAELAGEWRRMLRQVETNRQSFEAALRELAGRMQLTDLDQLVDRLIAAHTRGQPVAEVLAQLSATLRERRLQEATAAGNRASERMFLPVVAGIFLPLLVVIVAPAMSLLLGLVP
jgi:hypothetical protein